MKRQLAALILCAMLSGCKQQPDGDVVAVVNGDEIMASELNAAMPQLPAGADPKQARNTTLDRLINERLMVQGARSDGLDKSQEYITKVGAAENLILATMFVRKTASSISKPQAAKVDEFIAGNPSRFAQRVVMPADQIKVPRQAVTDAWLKDAKSLDEIAQILSAHNVRFERGRVTIDSFALEPADYAKVASVPIGRPFVVTQSGFLVFTTKLSVQPAPFTDEEANRAATAILQQKAQTDGVANRLKALRSAAKIEYQSGLAAPAAKASAAPAKK